MVGVKAVVDEVEVERERLLLAFWPPSFLLLPQIALLRPAGMYILFSLNQMKEAQLLGDRIILGIFGGVCHFGKIPKKSSFGFDHLMFMYDIRVLYAPFRFCAKLVRILPLNLLALDVHRFEIRFD